MLPGFTREKGEDRAGDSGKSKYQCPGAVRSILPKPRHFAQPRNMTVNEGNVLVC